MNETGWQDWSWELTRPWMLWLLALIVPLIWYFYRSLSDFPRWQQRVSLGFRIVILLLLILALAGWTLLKPSDRQFVLLGIDRSLSVDEQAAQTIRDFRSAAEEVRGQHVLASMDFATTPSTISTDPQEAESSSAEERESTEERQPTEDSKPPVEGAVDDQLRPVSIAGDKEARSLPQPTPAIALEPSIIM